MPNAKPTIRCSKLDALFTCAPSVLLTVAGQPPIRSVTGEAAELGKVAHAAMADYVETKGVDLRSLAAKYNFSPDDTAELGRMVSAGMRAWAELEAHLPYPRCEVELSADLGHLVLEGTADVMSPVDENRAVILDWKTGRIDGGYHHQLRGYALLAWDTMGRPAEATITTVVAFLRHGYTRVVNYTPTDLLAWENDLKRNVLSQTTAYHVGSHCANCDHYHTCEARRAVVRDTIESVLLDAESAKDKGVLQFFDAASNLITGITADNKGEFAVGTNLADLVFRVKLMEQAADEAKGLIRQALQRVGDIPLHDGTSLTLRQVTVKKVDAPKALRMLRSYLDEGQIAEAMTLSLTGLTDAYGKLQPRGQRKAAMDALTAALSGAGAIIEQHQQRMERVDSDSPKLQPTEPADAGAKAP